MTRKEKEQMARRQYIIDAATTIFARDGYENASMNEIAKSSEFTKRTLYQYFEDKADLYLSVLLYHYEKMIETLLSEEYKGKNGLEILRESLYKQYEYYLAHPEVFRIMYDIGNVRVQTQNSKINDFLTLDAKITASLKHIIENGQKDGSISNKEDALTTTINLKFFVTAIFDKLIIVGKSYAKHINKTEDEFAKGLLELIIDTLKKIN
jgi:AcrR family transcriptional regulator